MEDAAAIAEIEAFIAGLEGLLPHRFEVVTALGDGTPISGARWIHRPLSRAIRGRCQGVAAEIRSVSSRRN
jgi:hypothetical protein